MLTPFISSFRIELAIIFTVTIVIGISYYQESSSSSRTNNIKARRRSKNFSTALGIPSGIDLDEVGGNRSQSGIPQGMNHSERANSGNNLTSIGSPFGNNLSNGFPILENPTSTNQTETDNAMWQSKTHRTSNVPTCSSSLIINNYNARGQS